MYNSHRIPPGPPGPPPPGPPPNRVGELLDNLRVEFETQIHQNRSTEEHCESCPGVIVALAGLKTCCWRSTLSCAFVYSFAARVVLAISAKKAAVRLHADSRPGPGSHDIVTIYLHAHN